MAAGTVRARREAGEFVVADTLLILGSYLLGTGDILTPLVPLLGYAFIVGGLFLAVKVFMSVSKTLSAVNSMLASAGADLRRADTDIKGSLELLRRQSAELRRLSREVREAERRINDVKQWVDGKDAKIQAELEKIFGHSSAFSRHSWANPLEKSLESHERRLKALEDAARNGRRGFAGRGLY